MSEIFHKSCYTSRSTGYKYRTLSTNTGEKKRRDSAEDNTFDSKLKELKREMCSRIEDEVDRMASARESMLNKFQKIDTKIDLMIELQERIAGLRKDLCGAEYALSEILAKVDKMEIATASNNGSSQSRRTLWRSPAPINEETELYDSEIDEIPVKDPGP